MRDGKYEIEELLKQEKMVQIAPQGYSMYPLLVPGRDQAILRQANVAQLKKGDVVLYRRQGSILVLHRLWKRTSEGFFMVGDNQIEVEGPLKEEQMLGVLTGFIRKGRFYSVQNPIYLLYAKSWLFLRPIRRPLQLTAAFAKRTGRKILSFFRKR